MLGKLRYREIQQFFFASRYVCCRRKGKFVVRIRDMSFSVSVSRPKLTSAVFRVRCEGADYIVRGPNVSTSVIVEKFRRRWETLLVYTRGKTYFFKFFLCPLFARKEHEVLGNCPQTTPRQLKPKIDAALESA